MRRPRTRREFELGLVMKTNPTPEEMERTQRFAEEFGFCEADLLDVVMKGSGLRPRQAASGPKSEADRDGKESEGTKR